MSKERVLIIDDDPVIVELVTTLLQSRSYDVITAFDGVKGLEKAKIEHPNIILLDIIMPTMNGYEVCDELKKDENTMKIPVVMLTSVDSREAIRNAHQSGADDYIVKPINLTTLLAKIKFFAKQKAKAPA
jgi:DNA-binding response OmpR family regulator